MVEKTSPIIKTKELKVIYNEGKPNEVRSLEGVDISIYPQEYIIIFGPSGCGKSTLLYSISGLQKPTYGEAEVAGKQISRMSKREMLDLHQRGIGMVFQAFYLVPSLKVIENVCLPKTFMGEKLKTRKERGMDLLRRFGIAEQYNKFPSQLSGGQKQRVSIARSLINDPSIILADEPVGNLDSESSKNVMQILKDLNETYKKTVILVTHNPEHLYFADRVFHMKDGKIVEEQINKEKRPVEAVKEELAAQGGEAEKEMSSELRILMRTFKNLTPDQIGSLLIPFKTDQLLNHVISDLTQEQISAAGEYLKDFLFNEIKIEGFKQKLDLDLEKGGAGWNKQRAESFSRRINEIIEISKKIEQSDSKTGAAILANYLEGVFQLKLDKGEEEILINTLEMRIDRKVDRLGLERRVDAPKSLGGMGLYKNTADKISREVEIIMLINYQGNK